jgi:hypothetical protein
MSGRQDGWRIACGLSLVGAALAALVAVRAIEAHDFDGLLDAAGARTGTANGLLAFGLAATAVCAAAVARRSAAWSMVILAVVGAGGAFAVGGLWLLPGLIFIAASLWSLMLVPDPFASERAGESLMGEDASGRAERRRDAGEARLPERRRAAEVGSMPIGADRGGRRR